MVFNRRSVPGFLKVKTVLYPGTEVSKRGVKHRGLQCLWRPRRTHGCASRLLDGAVSLAHTLACLNENFTQNLVRPVIPREFRLLSSRHAEELRTGLSREIANSLWHFCRHVGRPSVPVVIQHCHDAGSCLTHRLRVHHNFATLASNVAASGEYQQLFCGRILLYLEGLWGELFVPAMHGVPCWQI